MQAYTLNRQSEVRLRDLVASGRYTDEPWTFTAEDSNALLGSPPNWTTYGLWFLGIDPTTNDSSAGATAATTRDKSDFAWPFGKGDIANLNALKIIARAAGGDIARVAQECLDAAKAKDKDAESATGVGAGAGFEIMATASVESNAVGTPPRLPLVHIDAYNGGPLRLDNYKFPLYIEMDGLEGLHAQRPFLRDHDPDRILGHSTYNRVENGVLKQDGILSGDDAEVAQVVNMARKGFPWQASVGANTDKTKMELVGEGKTAEVNGRTITGPAFISHRTMLGETSILSVGADPDTQVKIAAKAAKPSITARAVGASMKFRAWAKAAGLKCGDMTEDQMKAARATFKAAFPNSDENDDSEDSDGGSGKSGDDGDGKKGKKADAGAALDVRAAGGNTDTAGGAAADITAKALTDLRASMVAEQQRIAAVRKLCDTSRVSDIAAKAIADIEAKAITEGWSAETTELHVLRTSRENSSGPYVNTPRSSDIEAACVIGSLARSGGVMEKYAFEGMTDKQKEIASGKKLRGMGLHEVMFNVAAAHGVPFVPGRVDNEFLGDLLYNETRIRHRSGRDVRAAGGPGYSTMSLSGILENILNKMILQMYDTFPSVADQICWQRDTIDFKITKTYRMTMDGQLGEVDETGELQNIGAQDETYSNQLKTYGGVCVVTRQKLINDDMGAITDLPKAMTELALNLREQLIFTALYSGLSTAAPGASVNVPANGFNFYSTTANNYFTGAGSALSISSLTTADQALMEQQDANQNPVNLQGDRMLVPPALKATANNIFEGAQLVVTALGSTSSAAVIPDKQAFANVYRPIATPWMGARSRVAGFTNTNWLLAGDPATGKAPLQIAYLRGQKSPIVERGEANFNTLGIYLRIFYDVAAALHDWRTSVWSAGA